MDITSAFKSEIFRPLVTIVVPGAIATGPYLLVANYYNPQILKFWESSPSAFVGILLLIVLAAGLILEDIGSRIEGIWDKIRMKKNPSYKKEWDEYLQLFIKDDIVGQRYLRTVLVRLKFELSMGPALFFTSVGLLWFNETCTSWKRSSSVCQAFIVFLVGTYLLWESFESGKVLADTRLLIFKADQKRAETLREGVAKQGGGK